MEKLQKPLHVSPSYMYIKCGDCGTFARIMLMMPTNDMKVVYIALCPKCFLQGDTRSIYAIHNDADPELWMALMAHPHIPVMGEKEDG